LGKKILAACGEHCGLCPYFKRERTPHCSGCGDQKGHLFWGECKVYLCAAEHDLDHCGLYNDFPGNLSVESFDPEHGEESAILRGRLLAYRKRAGTEKYVGRIISNFLRARSQALTIQFPLFLSIVIYL